MVKRVWTRNHEKLALTILLMIITSMLLSGCLYPKEMRKDNQASVKEGILLVQHAVDEFFTANGILPLVTADMDTPRYEKFKVDFNALISAKLLSAIPADAFESGGHHTYLILNEETKPIVRVMDLITAQRANDLQRLVTLHLQETGEVPLGIERYPGYYEIPLSKIKAKELEVNSPYSGEAISFMMDHRGNVYADYAFDIMQAIELAGGLDNVKQYADLRELLVEASSFSPVKSVKVVWQNNTVVPVIE